MCKMEAIISIPILTRLGGLEILSLYLSINLKSIHFSNGYYDMYRVLKNAKQPIHGRYCFKPGSGNQALPFTSCVTLENFLYSLNSHLLVCEMRFIIIHASQSYYKNFVKSTIYTLSAVPGTKQ